MIHKRHYFISNSRVSILQIISGGAARLCCSYINTFILFFNRISRADWLLAAWHELIFLLGEAKKFI